MHARLRDCALFAGLVLATGCSEKGPRSCDLDTDALVMLATVSETDVGVEIEIEFETATTDTEMLGTALALCPGSDSLTVNGMALEERLTLGHLYYYLKVEPEDEAPEYTILLERKDKDQPNVEASIRMPPTFEFTTPAAGSQHSRAAELDVSWGPAWPDNTIELDIVDEIGSTCINGLGYYVDPVEDSGNYTVPANALSGPAGGSCDVTIVATRVLEAPYPEVLAPGGGLTAVVTRGLPFQSID